MEEDQFDDGWYAEGFQIMDGFWSSDERATPSGADTAAGSASHTMPGPGRAPNAPPYSYASAISAARAGSHVPTNANASVPMGFRPYDETSTAGTDDGWTSTSASGSGSMNFGENTASFPFSFSGDNISSSPQLLQLPQYDPEAESQAPYAQQAQLDTLPDTTWGGDTGIDDAGDSGGTVGFGFTAVSGDSHPGSYVGDAAGSLEMSRSDINPKAAALVPGYASAPVSPVSSRDRLAHDGKRVSAKKSPTVGAPRELRSASRTSKNTGKAAESTEQQRSRNSHNIVEKQYRNRLNAQFEELLATLPLSSPAGSSLDGDEGDATVSDRRLRMGDKKRFSKGEVLEMARQRILFLEEENRKIEQDMEKLKRHARGC